MATKYFRDLIAEATWTSDRIASATGLTRGSIPECPVFFENPAGRLIDSSVQAVYEDGIMWVKIA